jgi:hypothetical protein
MWDYNCKDGTVAERIDNTHASFGEVSAISRYDRQTVDNRRRRDGAVLNWHAFPGYAKTRQQFGPFQARFRVPAQAVQTPDSAFFPLVE